MIVTLGQAYSFHQLGQRSNQEDARYPDSDKPSIKQRFFVVCDGVGGSRNGEVASTTVCESLSKEFAKIDFSKDFTNQEFSKVLGIAYEALDNVVKNGDDDMATTMTCAVFHGGGATLAHIGDSRIYQIRPSQGVIYRSDDHSLVNQMIHSGIITPDEAVNHPQRNIITRCMEPQLRSDDSRHMATVMRTCDIKPNDYFFLCTDGVLDSLSEEQMISIITDDTTCENKNKMIASASKNSRDNNTAILIPVVSVEEDDESPALSKEQNNTLHHVKVVQSIEEVEPVIGIRKDDTFSMIMNKIEKLFKFS